jgi:hypothetical protein
VVSIVNDDQSGWDGVVDPVNCLDCVVEALDARMTGLELHDRLVAPRKPTPSIVIPGFPRDVGRCSSCMPGVGTLQICEVTV